MFCKRIKSNLKNRSEWVKAFLGFALAFLSIALLIHQVKFLISETASLPYHFFLHLPNIAPEREDYTMLESAWYQGKIIKRIIGVAGDFIDVNLNGEVFVNQRKVGHTIAIASDGRALKTIQAQIIPKGYVFLYGEHPKSFDSRYQELGLIPLSSLQGLVIPLG